MSKPFQISIRQMLCAVALFSVGLALCRASLNHHIRSEYFAGGLCCLGAGIGALFGSPIAAAMVSTETTRRRLLWNGLGLAVIAAIFVNGRTYFYNFFCGPFACDDGWIALIVLVPVGGFCLFNLLRVPFPKIMAGQQSPNS